jgi:hypothetical protein
VADRRSENDVYRITDAGVALSDDQAARTRRYLISMAIRTACFLGAVFTQGWLRWTLVAGALLLPYVAVVIANAGRERRDPAPATFVVDPRPSLGPGQDGGPPPTT